MRILPSFVIAALLFCTSGAFAQNIQYKSYVSASGPFGQPSLRHQFIDNFMFAATSRFTVTATTGGTVYPDQLFDGIYDSQPCIIPAGGTGVFSINFTSKGSSIIVYPGGKVYIHFYSASVPQSVTGRVQKNDGTWYDITGWTNIATTAPYAVWQGTVPGAFNNCQEMELTITAQASAVASLTEIEYVHDRTVFEPGILTKFTNHQIYKDFTWRDTDMSNSAFIKSNGAAFFKGNVGIGAGQTAPTVPLQVAGNSILNGNVKVTSLTMTASAGAGKILTSDASGNATWQLPAAGSGGWGIGGNASTSEYKLGTTNSFDLQLMANNAVHMRVGANGNVGIGVTSVGADYKLYVNGFIKAKKLRIDMNGWADYVFDPSYSLMPLPQLEKFIIANRHLPEIPTAAEVEKEGIDVGSNQTALLKKIEELTLYIIEQNKKLESQQLRIEALEKKSAGTR
ncbi:MAG: hypothetical protein ACTHMC_15775 [Pseudobacter sp.]|uniref:hypothetical protein n=1 Tax=Pseudobacter sp. TaxID=2045420 RepID=UPI003F81D182